MLQNHSLFIQLMFLLDFNIGLFVSCFLDLLLLTLSCPDNQSHHDFLSVL